MGIRTPVTPDAQPRFPFDVEFQKSLLKLICQDSNFGASMGGHMNPQYFENEVLSWSMHVALEYRQKYGAMPSLQMLRSECRNIDSGMRPVYEATLEQVEQAPLKDEQWMRDKVTDFVKRNIFVGAINETRHLFNSGKITESYDLMMERMEKVLKTMWEPADQSWFYAELPRRQMERWKEDYGDSIPTGFPWLDHVLDGGLSKGEMGIWIAYAKHGKSTMLVQHGIAATTVAMKKVVHFVFEGSRRLVENRYDAALMDEWYSNVKRGEIDDKKYADAWRNYQQMRALLVIRGFTEEWDYSVVDVHDGIKSLQREWGWDPDLVIVDYGDLLRGRAKSYKSETEKQQAAFRDLKSLANRGYGLWTASQAQRPDKDAEITPHLIKSRMIADCYAKVRVADFLGSLNMTLEERKLQLMRIYAELYRDNEADDTRLVSAKLDRMLIREDFTLPQVPKEQQQTQTSAPVPRQTQMPV